MDLGKSVLKKVLSNNTPGRRYLPMAGLQQDCKGQAVMTLSQGLVTASSPPPLTSTQARLHSYIKRHSFPCWCPEAATKVSQNMAESLSKCAHCAHIPHVTSFTEWALGMLGKEAIRGITSLYNMQALRKCEVMTYM
eukprot:1156081-Pelagomonas_calceolata.AAC.10